MVMVELDELWTAGEGNNGGDYSRIGDVFLSDFNGLFCNKVVNEGYWVLNRFSLCSVFA